MLNSQKCITEYYTVCQIYSKYQPNKCPMACNEMVFNGSEVLTAVVMKSTIFWDIMLCSPLRVNQRFGGGTYRLHLQGWRLSWASDQRERWWRHVPLKSKLTFNGLQGIISQKIGLFVFNSVLWATFPQFYLNPFNLSKEKYNINLLLFIIPPWLSEFGHQFNISSFTWR
jgi:hypothetical protein